MRRSVVLASALAAAAFAAPAAAQYAPGDANGKYQYCSNVAAQKSGWNGSTQNPNSKSVARGGAVGAGAGALIGGMGGGNAGRGAAIGAAFGLVAGESRRAGGERNVQQQQNTYYNVLNACLQS